MTEKKVGSSSRTFPFTAGTKVKEICPKQVGRVNVLIYNNGSITAYVVAAQNDKYTSGIPILAGATYTNDTTIAALYIVTASSTSDMRVQVDSE